MCHPSEIEATLRGSEELRQRIVRDIGSSTVTLFAVFDSKEGDRLELAGTGTLVIVGGSHYILTAAHVWEEVLKSAAKLGITLTDNINHSYLMDVKAIVPCGLPKPSIWGELGPYIVLLLVPSEYLDAIKASVPVGRGDGSPRTRDLKYQRCLTPASVAYRTAATPSGDSNSMI